MFACHWSCSSPSFYRPREREAPLHESKVGRVGRRSCCVASCPLGFLSTGGLLRRTSPPFIMTPLGMEWLNWYYKPSYGLTRMYPYLERSSVWYREFQIWEVRRNPDPWVGRGGLCGMWFCFQPPIDGQGSGETGLKDNPSYLQPLGGQGLVKAEPWYRTIREGRGSDKTCYCCWIQMSFIHLHNPSFVVNPSPRCTHVIHHRHIALILWTWCYSNSIIRSILAKINSLTH